MATAVFKKNKQVAGKFAARNVHILGTCAQYSIIAIINISLIRHAPFASVIFNTLMEHKLQ